MIYATASVITEEFVVTIHKIISQKYKQSQWKERISKDTECRRTKLSILTQKAKGGTVSQRKIRQLLSQYKLKIEEELPVIIEKIKQ